MPGNSVTSNEMRYFRATDVYVSERVGRGGVSDSAAPSPATAAIPMPQVNDD